MRDELLCDFILCDGFAFRSVVELYGEPTTCNQEAPASIFAEDSPEFLRCTGLPAYVTPIEPVLHYRPSTHNAHRLREIVRSRVYTLSCDLHSFWTEKVEQSHQRANERAPLPCCLKKSVALDRQRTPEST